MRKAAEKGMHLGGTGIIAHRCEKDRRPIRTLNISLEDVGYDVVWMCCLKIGKGLSR